MAKDLFVELDRCTYCGRPGTTAWDTDLVSCHSEVCQTLAYAEVRRRRRGRPEKKHQRFRYLRAAR